MVKEFDAGLDEVYPAGEEPLEAAGAGRGRGALGVPDLADVLAVALRAREWLERLAADHTR